MSDTKISDFLQVDGGDISNITAIAAVGTASGGATGQNVQISGSELEGSLALDVTQLTENIGNDGEVLKVVAGAPAWAASTDDDTTYTIDVPSLTTNIELLGSDTSTTNVTFTGGDVIGITRTSGTELTVDHSAVTRTDTTSAASPAAGASFTCLDTITTSTQGHITAANLKTVTLPAAGGGGGGGFQTLTAGATVNWDATSGISAQLTPTATATPNTLNMTNFSAGDSGSLKIIPTVSANVILPANSKAAGGNIILSEVNPSLLEFFYDGSNFYWWPESNMLDPIYIPAISKTNLVSFYVPSTYEGSVGDVPTGGAWKNSNTGNNLIGDLTRAGTDLDDVQFVARDDGNEIPAHFVFGSDGSNSSSAFNSGTFPAAFGADWSAGVWLQVVPGTATASYVGVLDGDKDDDEAMYIDDRRFSLYNSGQNYSNFPALTSANNLEDVWLYYGVSINDTNDTCTFYIGSQLTLDNAGGTITGFNGNAININADGLYEETISVTISEGTWNDFAYGAAGSTNQYEYEGKLGMCAVYSADISAATHITNWNATKEYYFIS